MRRIADDGLVKVANLDLDFAFGVGKRTDVSDVTVAATPDRRPAGMLFDECLSSHL